MKTIANVLIFLGAGSIIFGLFRCNITLGCIVTGLALVGAGVGILASTRAK